MTLLLQGAGFQTAPTSGGDPIGDALRADVKAYYKLSDTSDATGRGNTLTNIRSVQFSAGLVGNAAQFNGLIYNSDTATLDGNWLTIDSNPDVTLGANQSFCISLWVRYSKTVDLVGYIFVAKGNQLFDQEYSVSIVAPLYRPIWFIAGWDSNYPEVDSAFELTENQWHHIVAYYNNVAGELGLITDHGTPETVSYSGGNLAGVVGPLTIGSNAVAGSAAYSVNGLIDEMGIWHRVLTPAEITYLYNSGAGKALYP